MAAIPLAETIGANIEAARQRKGWRQGLLTERVGIAQGAMSRIETGDRVPSVELLLAIANALDCSLLELVKGIEAPNQEAYRKGYEDGWGGCAAEVQRHLTWKPPETPQPTT